MKITRRQLRRLIKEELTHLFEQTGIPPVEPGPVDTSDYENAMQGAGWVRKYQEEMEDVPRHEGDEAPKLKFPNDVPGFNLGGGLQYDYYASINKLIDSENIGSWRSICSKFVKDLSHTDASYIEDQIDCMLCATRLDPKYSSSCPSIDRCI